MGREGNRAAERPRWDIAEVFTAEHVRAGLAGLVVVVVGGLLADKALRRPVGLLAAGVLAVAGTVVGGSVVDEAGGDLALVSDGQRVLALTAVVVTGAGAVLVARRSVDVALACAVAAVVGVYVGVPETDAVLPAAGMIAGLGVARVLTVRVSPGALVPLVAVTVWVTALGAVGRTFPLVGGLLTLGVLLVWPVGRLIAARLPDRWPRAPFGWWIVVAQTVLAVGAGRVVGAADDPGWALVAAFLVAALAVSVVVEPLDDDALLSSGAARRADRPPPDPPR